MDSTREKVTIAAIRDVQEPAAADLQVVTFRAGEEEFCLDILGVQEIIRVPHLTRVPRSAEIVQGVMNLRGKIVPVIAMRKVFSLEEIAQDRQARIIVIEVRGLVLGMMVDAVSEVLRTPRNRIEAPPQMGKAEQEFVSGVIKSNDRLLLLLDVDRLIEEDELRQASRTEPAQEAIRA